MTVPPLSARSVSSRFSFQKAYRSRVENRSYSSLALLIKSNIILSVVAASWRRSRILWRPIKQFSILAVAYEIVLLSKEKFSSDVS